MHKKPHVFPQNIFYLYAYFIPNIKFGRQPKERKLKIFYAH